MPLFEVKLLIEDESEEAVKKTLAEHNLNYSNIQIAKGKRTLQQNAALHLYFTLVSQELNEYGLDMRTFIKEGIEISWTPYSVKEYLWKPLQNALLGKKSTTQLNKTEEINLLYDNLNKVLAERSNGEISIPFPRLDNLIEQTQ